MGYLLLPAFSYNQIIQSTSRHNNNDARRDHHLSLNNSPLMLTSSCLVISFETLEEEEVHALSNYIGRTSLIREFPSRNPSPPNLNNIFFKHTHHLREGPPSRSYSLEKHRSYLWWNVFLYSSRPITTSRSNGYLQRSSSLELCKIWGILLHRRHLPWRS